GRVRLGEIDDGAILICDTIYDKISGIDSEIIDVIELQYLLGEGRGCKCGKSAKKGEGARDHFS
ncbi:hypothetical protein N9967_02355, partial [bacterium]|nr:hypothetical protein [bacterium]